MMATMMPERISSKRAIIDSEVSGQKSEVRSQKSEVRLDSDCLVKVEVN